MKAIESFLEKKIGLSVEAVGSETIGKAIKQLMKKSDLSDPGEYLRHLEKFEGEWEKLVEAVIVPETWFFRNRESFSFLGNEVKLKWMAENKGRMLRVLSLPCSTGEEPYSIAMTLIDKGIERSRFHIDALDISGRALKKARRGIYGNNSFRGAELSYRERFFDEVPNDENNGAFKMRTAVRSTVHFIQGNLMDENILAGEARYDVIFFRNLLIYLNPTGKKKSVDLLDRLLVENGLLFVGHVERPIINKPGFVWSGEPGTFVCRKEVVKKKKNLKALPNSVPELSKKIPETGMGPGKRVENRVSPTPTKFEQTLDKAGKLADSGNLREAFNLCEKCLNEDPFHVQAHFLMGLICQGLGNETLAWDYFNKTAYLDPNHHEALSHMAFLEEQRGDGKRASNLRNRIRRILGEEE